MTSPRDMALESTMNSQRSSALLTPIMKSAVDINRRKVPCEGRRIFFLNRNCFNGIFRVNRKGNFNVPFSDSRVPPYPSKETFLASIEKLRSAKLDCADFASVCDRNVTRGDFVYLDPPYYVPKQRMFREYVPHDFAKEDVDRLRDLLSLIEGRGGYFLMNYPDCYMMRRIARQWNHHCIETRRTVSGTLASRGNSSEILIYNFERLA